MLSILIPTYNYDIPQLVSDLYKQATDCRIDFEIIVMEDGSEKFLAKNQSVKKLPFVNYTVLPQNIGRAAIRNRLADSAKYEHLLFMDCDAEVPDEYFLRRYLPFCAEKCVVIGGTAYDKSENNPKFSLRLKYGREREAKIENFSTFNFLISKNLFQSVRFDETLKTYGYEDTLFGHLLKESGVKVYFIDNKLIHKGLDENSAFLKKAAEGTKNLMKLYNSGIYPFLPTYSKILNFYLKIKKWHLQKIISIIFKMLKSLLVKNLTGKNPSLFWFDFYKLGFLCGVSGKKM